MALETLHDLGYNIFCRVSSPSPDHSPGGTGVRESLPSSCRGENAGHICPRGSSDTELWFQHLSGRSTLPKALGSLGQAGQGNDYALESQMPETFSLLGSLIPACREEIWDQGKLEQGGQTAGSKTSVPMQLGLPLFITQFRDEKVPELHFMVLFWATGVPTLKTPQIIKQKQRKKASIPCSDFPISMNNTTIHPVTLVKNLQVILDSSSLVSHMQSTGKFYFLCSRNIWIWSAPGQHCTYNKTWNPFQGPWGSTDLSSLPSFLFNKHSWLCLRALVHGHTRPIHSSPVTFPWLSTITFSSRITSSQRPF